MGSIRLERSSWPGRIRDNYEILDWDLEAGPFLDLVNEQNRVCVSFVRGLKLAFFGAEPAEDTGSGLPGELVNRDEDPPVIRIRGGAVRLGRSAVEGDPGTWYQVPHAKSILEMVDREEIRFAKDRFTDFDGVMHWFSSRDILKGRRFDDSGIAEQLSPLAVYNREWMLGLFRRLGLKPGDRFLDIGCGGSPWACRLAHEYGLEAWGCDEFPEEVYRQRHSWMHYFRGHLRDFPALPEKFDFIYSRSLAPLYCMPRLDFPQLTDFRDRLLAGLTEKGSLYLVAYTDNSGIRRGEDGWSNLTLRDFRSWLGGDFPWVETSYFNKASLLVSRKEAIPGWSGEMPWKLDEQKAWRQIQEGSLSKRDYYRLLLRVMQVMWTRVDLSGQSAVFIMGDGTLARDFEKLIETGYPGIRRLGIGLNLPEGLPEEAFVFVMPGFRLPAEREWSHHVEYRELIERWSCGDLFLVGGDFDHTRINELIKLEERREENRRHDQVVNRMAVVARSCERKRWKEAEAAMVLALGRESFNFVFRQICRLLNAMGSSEAVREYCENCLKRYPGESRIIQRRLSDLEKGNQADSGESEASGKNPRLFARQRIRETLTGAAVTIGNGEWGRVVAEMQGRFGPVPLNNVVGELLDEVHAFTGPEATIPFSVALGNHVPDQKYRIMDSCIRFLKEKRAKADIQKTAVGTMLEVLEGLVEENPSQFRYRLRRCELVVRNRADRFRGKAIEDIRYLDQMDLSGDVRSRVEKLKGQLII